jgi:hypothetical protein
MQFSRTFYYYFVIESHLKSFIGAWNFWTIVINRERSGSHCSECEDQGYKAVKSRWSRPTFHRRLHHRPHYPVVGLEKLSRVDLNSEPPEYEAGDLTTRPRRMAERVSFDPSLLRCCPTIPHGGDCGDRRYSSYSFSSSALDGGEWSASRPSRALPPGKGPPVPIIQESGWAPEPVWTQRLEEKFFSLCRGSNLDRSVIQPVARHYTDWATRLTIVRMRIAKCLTDSSELMVENKHVPFVKTPCSHLYSFGKWLE